MNILIFVGAGTSVELGVPAMEEMAKEFLIHCNQWNVEPETVGRLLEAKLDIEELIEQLDKLCNAKDPLSKIFGIQDQLNQVGTIQSEVEWFVQHMAERVTSADARLMWGAVLEASKDHKITFATTNYDRGIELAGNSVGIRLKDGFEDFGGLEKSTWKGFEFEDDQGLLIKLHGSTDWYLDIENQYPCKLRHPMPLFGKATLKLISGDSLGSALILPSREKLLTKPPYLELSQSFLNAGGRCDVAIFVGASLRDGHILNAVRTIANKRPVYYVNPFGDTPNVVNIRHIKQTASQFLISTFPCALASTDPLHILDQHANKSEAEPIRTLELLRAATNASNPEAQRCEAIEKLDEFSVQLPRTQVSNLINDENSTVATFALGLAAISDQRKQLIEDARKSVHISNARFLEELDILEQFGRP